MGDAAYGRPDAPSVFKDPLLRALRGAGSDDVEGDWCVYTDRLNIGINYIVERTASGEEGARAFFMIPHFLNLIQLFLSHSIPYTYQNMSLLPLL